MKNYKKIEIIETVGAVAVYDGHLHMFGENTEMR